MYVCMSLQWRQIYFIPHRERDKASARRAILGEVQRDPLHTSLGERCKFGARYKAFCSDC